MTGKKSAKILPSIKILVPERVLSFINKLPKDTNEGSSKCFTQILAFTPLSKALEVAFRIRKAQNPNGNCMNGLSGSKSQKRVLANRVP